MKLKEIVMKPIGFVSSPFKDTKDIPSQGIIADGIEMSIIVEDEYLDAMKDLNEGDLIDVIFNFHNVKNTLNIVFSHRHKIEMGVFSTRSPLRPNGIGVTTVKIQNIDRNIIRFIGGDMLDGTPVLDIKPNI